jgi:hypothetical protein
MFPVIKIFKATPLADGIFLANTVGDQNAQPQRLRTFRAFRLMPCPIAEDMARQRMSATPLFESADCGTMLSARRGLDYRPSDVLDSDTRPTLRSHLQAARHGPPQRINDTATGPTASAGGRSSPRRSRRNQDDPNDVVGHR